MVGGRKGISEPSVIIGRIFRLPSIENCVHPIDLRLLQDVGEHYSAHMREEKPAIDQSHATPKA
jgi:hypothetical protein